MFNLFKKKPAGRTASELVKLSQQNSCEEFTMSEKWIIGCYKYYCKLQESNEDKATADKWWSGCIKSYNDKLK